VQFDAPSAGQASIMTRVGISFVTVEQACANAEAQIPDFDFDGTFAVAQQAWREKLNVVEVDARGVSQDMQTTFWSGLYRTMISPQNYTGENPLWKSSEPYYDS
jgi:putative alpha-1,2-mannosidase